MQCDGLPSSSQRFNFMTPHDLSMTIIDSLFFRMMTRIAKTFFSLSLFSYQFLLALSVNPLSSTGIHLLRFIIDLFHLHVLLGLTCHTVAMLSLRIQLCGRQDGLHIE